MWSALALLAALVSPGGPPRYDGLAFSPYFEDARAGLRFDEMVDSAAVTGARNFSVVVSWAQADVRASKIAPHPKETQDDEVIRRVIRRARGRGMAVTVFPILWVERRGIGEWRGKLAPSDPEAWWRSYDAFILHYARLAAAERARVLCVGSELGAMEGERERWAALIGEVRAVFPGALLYSANWDHFEGPAFWDLVDLAGVTAYHQLTNRLNPTVDELVAAWAPIRQRLVRWQQGHGRPMVFTELGYPSVDGAARTPWDYTGRRPVNLAAQLHAYEAFERAWANTPELAGVYFWNWWGMGGPRDRWYTPRGKPAEAVILRWFARDPQ